MMSVQCFFFYILCYRLHLYVLLCYVCIWHAFNKRQLTYLLTVAAVLDNLPYAGPLYNNATITEARFSSTVLSQCKFLVRSS